MNSNGKQLKDFQRTIGSQPDKIPVFGGNVM